MGKKTATKGALITILVILLLLAVAVFGIASKGFTNFDPNTWKDSLISWGEKFNNTNEVTSNIKYFMTSIL